VLYDLKALNPAQNTEHARELLAAMDTRAINFLFFDYSNYFVIFNLYIPVARARGKADTG